MNCRECQERIQERWDGFGDAGGPDLDRHLAECSACRELFGAGKVLSYPRPRPLPPADLADRVVAGVLADRRRARLRFRLTTAALAASLLLAVAAGLTFTTPGKTLVTTVQKQLRGPAPVPPRPQVADADRPAREGKRRPEPAAAVSLNQSIEEAGSALAGLSRRTADETLGSARLVIPEVVAAPKEGPDLWQGTLDPPAESLKEAGRSMSAGLEPLATPARRALSLFWKELPPVESDAKRGT